MRQFLFLDLEETVITNWVDRKFINVEKLCHYLSEQSVTTIGVFSFAIFSDKDKKNFSDTLQAELEKNLQVKVSDEWIPTVEEIIAMASRTRFISPPMPERDFFDFYSKRSGFEEYCLSTSEFANSKCILIDDAVEDTRLILKDREVITINVDNLSR
jgi:hypothetical protein